MKKGLIHSIKPAYLVAALLLAALALLAACGGDDGGSEDGSPTASGESTRTSDGTPVTTPGGSPGLPVECTSGEEQRGLLADLEFNGDDGLFDVGEKIDMNLTLINCGDNEVVPGSLLAATRHCAYAHTAILQTAAQHAPDESCRPRDQTVFHSWQCLMVRPGVLTEANGLWIQRATAVHEAGTSER